MKVFRRLSVFALALLLLAATAQAAYYDVPEQSWARASIDRATELGLVTGSNGVFGLGNKVTRAEYATMLCRLMGWELTSPAVGSFADNRNPSKWYYSAIETAYAHGALRKISANVGVTEPLTRGEMAAMTVRAFGYASLAGEVQDDCAFADVHTNPGYIALSHRMGIMDGVGGGAFRPDEPALREQAAVVLLRAYDCLHTAAPAQKTVSKAPEGAALAEPLENRDARIPMCPRAPLESVYRAAVQAGRGGAVALNVAPYDAATGEALTREELDALLADEATNVCRSARYKSSYLLSGERVVWYESAADVAEKLELCRLLGIKTLYLIEKAP